MIIDYYFPLNRLIRILVYLQTSFERLLLSSSVILTPVSSWLESADMVVCDVIPLERVTRPPRWFTPPPPGGPVCGGGRFSPLDG